MLQDVPRHTNEADLLEEALHLLVLSHPDTSDPGRLDFVKVPIAERDIIDSPQPGPGLEPGRLVLPPPGPPVRGHSERGE